MTKEPILGVFFDPHSEKRMHPARMTRRIVPFLAVFLVLSWACQVRAECINPSYCHKHNLVVNATDVAGVFSGTLYDGEEIMYKVNIARDCKLVFDWSCSATTSNGISANVGSTYFFTVGEDQCWGYLSYDWSEHFCLFGLCTINNAEGTKSMFVGPQTLYIFMQASEEGGGTYTINLSSVPAIDNPTETEWNDSKETADTISGNEIRGSVGFANKRDLTSVVNLANAEITHDPADWYTGQVDPSGNVTLHFAWQDNVGRGDLHGVTVTLSGESAVGGEVTQSAPLAAQGELRLQNLVPGNQYYVSVTADQVTTWWWKDEFGAYVLNVGSGGVNLSPVYLLLNSE